MRILILGSTGLAGRALARQLSRQPELRVIGTVRQASFAAPLSGVTTVEFNFGQDSVVSLLRSTQASVIVNAIGVTRQALRAGHATETQAWSANRDLPKALADEATRAGTRVLHLSTDCVFDGAAAPYREDATLRPTDVYSASKAEGEVSAPVVTTVRTSFVGDHPSPLGLMSWLANRPRGATVMGYVDHVWNGLTVSALAMAVTSWVLGRVDLPALVHLYSRQSITKFELLCLLRDALGRRDLSVTPYETGKPVDRTLTSQHLATVEAWWRTCGYEEIPSFPQLIAPTTCASVGISI